MSLRATVKAVAWQSGSYSVDVIAKMPVDVIANEAERNVAIWLVYLYAVGSGLYRPSQDYHVGLRPSHNDS